MRKPRSNFYFAEHMVIRLWLFGLNLY